MSFVSMPRDEKANGSTKHVEVDSPDDESNVHPLPELPAAEDLPADVAPESDLANATRLLRDHGANLRFVKQLGWLHWDGRRWCVDQNGEAERNMFNVACDLVSRGHHLLSIAANASKAMARAIRQANRDLIEEGDLALACGKRLQSTRMMQSSLRAASILSGFVVSVDDLDRDPMLFTCGNGTIDLRTGQLREFRREDLITRASPVAFDPDAAAPTWEKFQSEVHPDPAIREFNQRFYGQALTGDVSEQVIAVCYGDGCNGKSTEHEAVRYVFGDYAIEAATGTFTEDNQGRSVENKLADLRGARLVTTSESGEGHKLNETLLKRATGGDLVSANRLYRETFWFHPQLKARMVTNHRPKVKGTDEGIWRRMRLIPYNVDFTGREDRELPSKLRDEAPGILAWAVRGCRAWQCDGLAAPEALLAQTRDWRNEDDTVKRFIADECTTTVPSAKARSADLYAAYRRWAAAEGIPERDLKTSNAFGRQLTKLGFAETRAERTRSRAGIGLPADENGKPKDGGRG